MAIAFTFSAFGMGISYLGYETKPLTVWSNKMKLSFAKWVMPPHHLSNGISVFLAISVVLGFAALLSFLNEQFLGLQKTIGLMALSLGLTLLLSILGDARSDHNI